MKKNTLYTANKWNRNLFDLGGYSPTGSQFYDFGAYTQPAAITGNAGLTGYQGVNVPKTINIEGLQGGAGTGWTKGLNTGNSFMKNNAGTLNTVAGTASPFLTKMISGGYSTGGVGEGVAQVGQAVGSALAATGIGGIAAPIVTLGAGILGGAINRGWGTKKNQKNINAIEGNTEAAKTTGNEFAGASDTEGFLSAANNMTNSMGFDNKDLVKGGWFSKGKAKREAQKYLNKEREALVMQNHSMVTGAQRVDNILDDNAMSNFAAWGGPLEQINNDNMGAIGYGFMSDYLTTKQKQNEARNKLTGITATPAFMQNFAEGGEIHIKHPGRLTRLKERTGKTEAELWAEGKPEVKKMITFARNARAWSKANGGKLHKDGVSIPENVLCGGGKLFHGGECLMPNMFDLGGDIQSNSADWTTGLTHIDAGGSHELNPNQGVQVGVDPEGTPNLVEENETIFNDYVYSNRITLDDEAKKVFHIGKKRDITYADLSKKLEKEASERPNDPISQAALKVQMQDLADQQERQKQKMEAERAREAFEALSPEEQTALMQQAAQQEQMAQQQAMQEQAMAEQAAAEQQPTSEEMTMAQEQQVMQADGSEAALGQEPQMACGGKINRFDKGGVLKFLNSLGYKTVADAEKAGWKPSDFGNYKDWKDINSNSKLSDDFTWTDEFSKRLTSPEHKAMLSLGWNPTAALLNRRWYEGDNGNNVGWTQSYGKKALNAEEFKDYANRYKNTLGWAVENDLIKAPEGNGTISIADITKAMREAPDWKKTDEWLYSSPANMASYLGMARGLNPDDDTKFINKWSPYGSFTKGTDGNWTYNLRGDLTDAEKQSFTDLFKKARTDNMVGVMYNNFHDPDTVTNRYVLDENGTPVLLTGDDLSGYEQLGTYSWGDAANNVNNNAILYRAKGTGTNGGPGTAGNAGNGTGSGSTREDREVTPNYKNDKLRYAGLFGPAVGLGMQMMDIGRPDTSGLQGVVDAYSRQGAVLADYKPIGNYLRYQPLDRMYYANQMQANARATDRALMNSSGANTGAAAAGLLANSYNSQIGLGNLYRQAEEYNDNLKKQVAEFNRGTDQFNSEAYNRTSLQNAETRNRNRQMNAQLGMQAAQAKMDADAGWYNGIYGNVAGLFKGIGDLGRENAQHNMIAEMAADGIFGTMSPRTNTGRRGKYLTFTKKSAAKGGKINKKKG